MTEPTLRAGPHVDWQTVWQAVTKQLSEDKLVPKFLTEDGIRVATLRALAAQIDIWRDADVEYPAVSLGANSGRLDLVVRARARTTVVEFKYPHEPRQTKPPWPDHLGSYFRDTYRLGMLACDGQVDDAIQVLVSGFDFLGFLQRTTTRLHLSEHATGGRTPLLLALTPARADKLAPITRKKIKNYEQSWQVIATRTAEIEIPAKGLWLAAYAVSGKRAAAPNR